MCIESIQGLQLWLYGGSDKDGAHRVREVLGEICST